MITYHSSSALCNPSAWLIQVDGKYLSLDGRLTVTRPSARNIAQCAIIAYDSSFHALEIGPEPVPGQPYDPPYVYISNPASKKTRVVADLKSLGDPAARRETLGNWQLGDLRQKTDLVWEMRSGGPLFALTWTVPGLGQAAFQVDEGENLWAVFGGEEIVGARDVEVTVRLDG